MLGNKTACVNITFGDISGYENSRKKKNSSCFELGSKKFENSSWDLIKMDHNTPVSSWAGVSFHSSVIIYASVSQSGPCRVWHNYSGSKWDFL